MTDTLREIQEALFRVLQHDRSIQESPEFSLVATQIAAGSARLTPEEQLDVYREQFFLRHIICLQEDFPGVEALVGRDVFEDLGRGFLRAFPPTAFSLRDFGAKFPDFLMSTALEFDPIDVLFDMARLEWALVEAFDAEDLPLLDTTLLQHIAPDAFDRVILSLDASLSLLDLQNPVHTIHAAVSEGGVVDLPTPQACWLAVYRCPDLSLSWCELSELAFRTLRGLQDGLPLAVALDRVATTLSTQTELEVLASSIGDWFVDWVRRGWVRGVKLPS